VGSAPSKNQNEVNNIFRNRPMELGQSDANNPQKDEKGVQLNYSRE